MFNGHRSGSSVFGSLPDTTTTDTTTTGGIGHRAKLGIVGAGGVGVILAAGVVAAPYLWSFLLRMISVSVAAIILVLLMVVAMVTSDDDCDCHHHHRR